MQLLGLPNSPYVRRTAICLDLLGVPFQLRGLSPFADWEAFRKINPVVKGPTLVCDDGEVMMDSSLILQFAEAALSEGRSLWPADARDLQHDMRALSLALAACEKSIQVVYELRLRPEEARFAPWLERIRSQVEAAFAALESELQQRPQAFADGFSHASVTAAVVWQFAGSVIGDLVPAPAHPRLASLSQRLETSDVFRKYSP